MAISYPLTPPEKPGFKNFAWEHESAVAVQPRTFTYQTKTYEWDGQIRRATCEVGAMPTRSDAARDIIDDWTAFILSLNGRAGTFYLQDPYRFASRGSIQNYPGQNGAVKGSGQVGDILETDGWPTGQTNLFKKGDWISINGRLYELRANASSDGSGNADLAIWPFARSDLADNAVIATGENAKGIFRMITPPVFNWNTDEEREGFAFSCEEAF